MWQAVHEDKDDYLPSATECPGTLFLIWTLLQLPKGNYRGPKETLTLLQTQNHREESKYLHLTRWILYRSIWIMKILKIFNEKFYENFKR